MPQRSDLDRRLAECEARFARDLVGGVDPLRDAAEAAARGRVGASPTGDVVAAIRAVVEGGVARDAALEAAALLARAEEVEVLLGTMATGAGEGIHSRFSACTLKLARAWLLLAGEADEASCDMARKLAAAAESEPNGVGERLAHPIDALRRVLAARSVPVR